MTFLLTEDQEMLRDTAMAFARDEMPVTRLRQLRDSGANGVDAETRQKLAELGFFGVIIPDEPGGEHFGLVGLGQVLEAQGRTLAPTPVLQTALIAASALQLGGEQWARLHVERHEAVCAGRSSCRDADCCGAYLWRSR